jgi:hypothetical protein
MSSELERAFEVWARAEVARIQARWSRLTPEQWAEFYRRNPKLASLKASQGRDGITRSGDAGSSVA